MMLEDRRPDPPGEPGCGRVPRCSWGSSSRSAQFFGKEKEMFCRVAFHLSEEKAFWRS